MEKKKGTEREKQDADVARSPERSEVTSAAHQFALPGAKICSCGEILSVEVGREDLRPLLETGQALLEAYETYATARSLRTDRPIWSVGFAYSGIRDAERTFLRELGRLGRSGTYPELIENCPPYGMSQEVVMAIDLTWAATCSPRFEEWMATRSPAKCDVAGRIADIKRTLELLRTTTGPPPVKADALDQLCESRANHSPDYRSVRWFGKEYTFTASQATCVRVLWEAWQQGTPEVGEQTILTAAEVETGQLRKLFKQHPALGTMIVAGSTKGSFRLASPGSPGNS